MEKQKKILFGSVDFVKQIFIWRKKND